MAQLLSDTPGRIRLRLDPQQRRPARAIQQRLTALPGVDDARFERRISTLTIFYNPDAVTREAILGILAASGVPLTIPEPDETRIEYSGVSPASQAILTNLASANEVVVRASRGTTDLKVAIPLLLLLLGGLRGLFSGFQFNRIPGYLFLWYAFDLFYKLHFLGRSLPSRETGQLQRGR
jgi:hypothetical protein